MDHIEYIDDIPDEIFPDKICSELLTLSLTYYSTILYYQNRWDILHPSVQFRFISKIKKILQIEWLNYNIDTDWDDY